MLPRKQGTMVEKEGQTPVYTKNAPSNSLSFFQVVQILSTLASLSAFATAVLSHFGSVHQAPTSTATTQTLFQTVFSRGYIILLGMTSKT